MYSIIIVDYNSIRETMHYIAHCAENIISEAPLHFVIIDNLPHSKSIQILTEEIQINFLDKYIYEEMQVVAFKYMGFDIRLILTGRNWGYAKGNNIGINFSGKEWEDDYIVISNNDIEFIEKIDLGKLKKIIDENRDIAVVGPHVKDMNGNDQGPYPKTTAWSELIVRPSKIIPELIWDHKVVNKDVKQNPEGIYYWVSGCFFICSREKMLEVNNFDEKTFLYAEEKILSERLLQKGYRMYYTNAITIIHRSSESVGKTFKNLEAEQVLFNSLFYYYKVYRKTSLFVLLIARINFACVKLMFLVGQKINRVFKIKAIN